MREKVKVIRNLSVLPCCMCYLHDLHEYLFITLSSVVITVLDDLEIRYGAVKKLSLFAFVWKNMLPLTKKDSMTRAMLRWCFAAISSKENYQISRVSMSLTMCPLKLWERWSINELFSGDIVVFVT